MTLWLSPNILRGLKHTAAGSSMQVQKMNEARKLLLLQAGLFMLIPLALLPLDVTVAFSGLLGGAVAFISSLIMYFLIFRHYRAQQPEKVLAKFYSAEIAKLIFAMAAFAIIVLNVKPLSFAAVILVYFVIQVIPAILINYR